jgi:hypothetical protein
MRLRLGEPIMFVLRQVVAGKLLLLSVIAYPVNAEPPRCELVSLRVHFNDARVVFSGEVVNMRRLGQFTDVTFKILASWKNARGSEIIAAANQEDPEMINFTKGQRYLVFATLFHDRLFVGACSGTMELANARQELRQLRKLTRRR